jgi:hypothetical protein
MCLFQAFSSAGLPIEFLEHGEMEKFRSSSLLKYWMNIAGWEKSWQGQIKALSPMGFLPHPPDGVDAIRSSPHHR